MKVIEFGHPLRNLASMLPFLQQLAYFNLLCEEHRYQTDVLGNSHRTLASQYRRLAELDLAIARRHENQDATEREETFAVVSVHNEEVHPGSRKAADVLE